MSKEQSQVGLGEATNMVYRYKKPYRIKKKKSILRSRFFWFGLLFLAVIWAILYFLFFSGIFQIEKVIITGGKVVSEENIKTLIPKKNIFLIDTQKIEKNILNGFSQIAEIEIHRGFPDALNILVIERSAVALWCEEDCFLADHEGVIIGKAPPESDLTRIYGAKEMLNKEKIASILEIQRALSEDFGVTTTQAVIVSERRLDVKTSEGWEAYFDSEGDLAWQLQELGLVLEKQITPEKRKKLEYIDLRFSRVFYK